MGLSIQLEAIRRLAAMFLIAAVAALPLVHTGHARADTASQASADLCCVDPCGCCDTQPGGDDMPCAPGDEQAPCNDDRPCDCPCCGKVVPVVSMITPLPVDAPFWGEQPALLPVRHDARPDSVAMRVDIQPPIV